MSCALNKHDLTGQLKPQQPEEHFHWKGRQRTNLHLEALYIDLINPRDEFECICNFFPHPDLTVICKHSKKNHFSHVCNAKCRQTHTHTIYA